MKTMATKTTITLFLFLLITQLFSSQSQPVTTNASTTCNALFLSYNHTVGYPIPPTAADPLDQPYRFESTLTLLNNGLDEIKSWSVSLGFQNRQILVSLTNAVLADGTSLPANLRNETILVGFPETDLKSSIETAGDVNQRTALLNLVGTQFGVGLPNVPLPVTFRLANPGYLCPPPITQGNNELVTCCIKRTDSQHNIKEDVEFLPRQEGDLVVMYDVIRSYDSNYFAEVSISNHNPLARLDNWKLSWDWMREEFIYSMRGAHPNIIDVSQCVFGPQGRYYKQLDFHEALNCERTPTIIDLSPTRANDTQVGNIPFCCRDGLILPPSMDPNRAKSAFQIQVFKMPPDLAPTDIYPPRNWRINGTTGSSYQCGTPIRVSQTQFPDETGLSSGSTAIASWQIVCNVTRPPVSRNCCVSFSAFYNESAVPCSTCACGCNRNSNSSQSCSSNETALLVRPVDLVLPFENRTKFTLAWAEANGRSVPNKLPCGDNCGVSINWHLLQDYKDGWQARMTVFHWSDTEVVDWFAAVQLDKGGLGMEKAYSFNASLLPDSNNIIMMKGLPGLNTIGAQRDGNNPARDPRVPGFQQSVVMFTKKVTPGINVGRGDGFPSKVIFNGEECALPQLLPLTSHASSTIPQQPMRLLFLLLTAFICLHFY